MRPSQILFVSGWASDQRMWDRVIKEIDPSISCRCVSWWDCLDPGDNALLQAFSEADGPLLVTGWSLGVLAVLSATLVRSDNVAALVLVSGTARMTADGDYPGTNPRVLSAMQTKLSRSPETVLRDFGTRCFEPLIDDHIHLLNDFVSAGMQLDREHLAAGLRYLQHFDIRSRLPELHMPACVIHGQEDKVIPLVNGQYLAQRLPKARFLELSGQGHAIPYLMPGTIVQAIRSFLDA